MCQVGGKAKVADASYLIIIQVENGEVPTHGEVSLKVGLKI